MKVLHVVRGLLNSSGTTHIVGPLSEEQARQGCDVTVYFVEQRGDAPVIPDRRLVATCCFTETLPLYHPGISVPFARALRHHISDYDFVHIHAVWNFPSCFTMYAASQAGVPYMIAPQGSLEPWAMHRHRWRKMLYARMFEIPLMNRATYMQALSAKEVQQIRAAGVHAPTVIVPNGVSLGHFDRKANPLRERLNLPPGCKTLLSLSRLDPKKGLDILIRGFAQFATRDDAVVLVIAGGDSGSGYRTTLESLARSEGIAARVILMGEVRGEEKYDILLGADAFALISHSEGLPVACIEAMGAGLPVIVTAGCNLPEVAASGAGLIVEGHADAVAEALAVIFDNADKAQRMGACALQLVRAKFTWEKIARQTCELYEQAMHGDRIATRHSYVAS